jgi:hypothetical protein
VNADRPDSGVDNVDRPVSPGLGWNRGGADGPAALGGSAGLGWSGAKNSSSGSGGMPLAAAARSLRSAASDSSRRSRCLISTPYPVIGTSSTASVATENIASPPSWCMRIVMLFGVGGVTGRLLGCAPFIAGRAFGGWSANAGAAKATSGTDTKLIAAAALANRGILNRNSRGDKRRGLPCEHTHSATSVLIRWGVLAEGSTTC